MGVYLELDSLHIAEPLLACAHPWAYLRKVNARLVIQGIVLVVAGSAVLGTARRLAEHAVPRSWPEPFGRRFDSDKPLRDFTWSYRAFGGGAVVLGLVWLVHGLS